MKPDVAADYIVVGGGSAGCVLASRLSEDPKVSVILIEEGPSDLNPAIHLPVMVYKTATGNLLQRFVQEVPKDVLRKRSEASMVQARVLGGGSSVNAMIYLRGIPYDFDRWSEFGAEGWGFDDVLPYYVRCEDNDALGGPMHGEGGPLKISYPEHVDDLTRAFLRACQQAGFAPRSDFNAGEQDGCGLYQVTTRKGRRSSAAVCYLRPARKRANLRVMTGTKALRLVIEGGRCTGVEIQRCTERRVLRAGREVALTAGAINTPRLMLLSGIGPAAHLREVGVPVLHDLPGVGQGLQDHMDVYMVYELAGRYGYDRYKSLPMKAWAGLQYALFREGPICSNVIEGGAFWRANDSDPHPDIQYAFLAGSGVEEGVPPVAGGYGCTLNACFTRPRSRGWVGLKSNRPEDAPRIVPNYLSDPYDLDSMARAVKKGREIMSRPAMTNLVRAERLPERDLVSMDDYRGYVRDWAQGALHPVGTCRVGNDPMAVVDSQLRVHGIAGLRIADMSIFPFVPSGNTNGPAIMTGERAADFIRRGRN
ncbi:GMC family oxidoreductase N-terminal domain-containing protein [Tabrizicola sp. KVB23]|uniref:GMC family oxidoreductase N-terminal domain-containing protein n=2 Tax=Fuscibacter oryzae TaxID=2803939 RepID=A0A8J7MTM0_9RHOB|nr:GMC family oxidoreductase N-terminal domain-containing protein [Fuscibacter oryzae]